MYTTSYLENCISSQLTGQGQAGELSGVPNHVVGLLDGMLEGVPKHTNLVNDDYHVKYCVSIRVLKIKHIFFMKILLTKCTFTL